MSAPPVHVGDVAFMFTDVAGSTALARAHAQAWPAILSEHRRRIRGVVLRHRGTVVDEEGDSFFVVFESADAAVAAALDVQRSLLTPIVAEGLNVLVRLGVHVGEAVVSDGRYVGLEVHHAARIAHVAHGGQVLVSEPARGALRSPLPDGATLVSLGDHELKDFGPRRLHQLCHPALPVVFPRSPAAVMPLRLPPATTSFVGREAELARLQAAIGENRLVTLVAAGGVGKTRLAIETAASVADEHKDGVAFVDLAAVERGGDVALAVVRALDLVEGPAIDTDELVVEHLRTRRTLLLLDNCEHVLRDAAALASRLVGACPHVRLLCTSREALHVESEHVVRLAPLDVEVDGAAVELFLQRAHLDAPPADRARVSAICARLEGLPLAVELAAARTRTLSLEQLEARLADRFRMVAGGARDKPARQQTLWAAIDWSHQLLDQRERTVLRRVSVLPGAFTLEAAEHVCSGRDVRGDEVYDALTQLVDQSLVEVVRASQIRFRLLESVREYALQRLREVGEEDDVRMLQVARVSELARRASSALLTPDDAVWLRRLDEELPDVQAAVRWAATTAPAVAAQCVGDLWVYWTGGGALMEGRDLCEVALPVMASADAVTRARLLACASNVALWLQDAGSAAQHSAAAVALGDDHRDDHRFAWSTGWALLDLAVLAEEAGNLAEAASSSARALEGADQYGDDVVTSRALMHMARVVALRGEQRRALSLLEDAAHLVRARGSRLGMNRVLLTLSAAYELCAQPRSARAVADEARFAAEEAADVVGVHLACERVASLAASGGDLVEAREAALQVLASGRSVGQRLFVARGLATCAWVAARDGDARRVDLLVDQPEVEGDAGLHAELLRARAALALDEGVPEQARALLARASTLLSEVEAPQVAAAVLVTTAELEERSGRAPKSRDALVRLVDLGKHPPPPPRWQAYDPHWLGRADGRPRALEALARLLEAEGRPADAQETRSLATALSERSHHQSSGEDGAALLLPR